MLTFGVLLLALIAAAIGYSVRRQLRWRQGAGFKPITKFAPEEPIRQGPTDLESCTLAGAMPPAALEVTANEHERRPQTAGEPHVHDALPQAVFGSATLRQVYQGRRPLYDFSCGFGTEEAERWRL